MSAENAPLHDKIKELEGQLRVATNERFLCSVKAQNLEVENAGIVGRQHGLAAQLADSQKRCVELRDMLNEERAISAGLRNEAQRRMTELDKARNERDEAEHSRQQLLIENAELRGYIRRVDMDRPSNEPMVTIPLTSIDIGRNRVFDVKR